VNYLISLKPDTIVKVCASDAADAGGIMAVLQKVTQKYITLAVWTPAAPGKSPEESLAVARWYLAESRAVQEPPPQPAALLPTTLLPEGPIDAALRRIATSGGAEPPPPAAPPLAAPQGLATNNREATALQVSSTLLSTLRKIREQLLTSGSEEPLIHLMGIPDNTGMVHYLVQVPRPSIVVLYDCRQNIMQFVLRVCDRDGYVALEFRPPASAGAAT